MVNVTPLIWHTYGSVMGFVDPHKTIEVADLAWPSNNWATGRHALFAARDTWKKNTESEKKPGSVCQQFKKILLSWVQMQVSASAQLFLLTWQAKWPISHFSTFFGATRGYSHYPPPIELVKTAISMKSPPDQPFWDWAAFSSPKWSIKTLNFIIHHLCTAMGE